MHLKYKVLLITIAVMLVTSLAVSYAYFVFTTKTDGTPQMQSLQTVVLDSSTIDLEGFNIISDKGIYPGHKTITKYKVSATGLDKITYKIKYTGTNSLDTALNYRLYRTNTDENPTITCNMVKTSGPNVQYSENCVESISTIGTVIQSGTIGVSPTQKDFDLKLNEVIVANLNTTVTYYYLIIEYPNLNSKQNNTGTYEGTISLEPTKIDNP